MHYLRYFLLLLALCAHFSGAYALQSQNTAYQLYISQFKDLAIEQMQRYRIPASITLAQGLFESRAGQSRLATLGNNHFGIKCHGWTGRSINADDDALSECFRAYDNAKQSYETTASSFATTNAMPRFSSLTPPTIALGREA